MTKVNCRLPIKSGISFGPRAHGVPLSRVLDVSDSFPICNQGFTGVSTAIFSVRDVYQLAAASSFLFGNLAV